MTELQLTLKCPYCNHDFNVSPPDSWHSEHSFDEPMMSNVHGEIKKQKIVCRNTKCGKTITIYWFAPMEYFARM
jgi:hypothetical protein